MLTSESELLSAAFYLCDCTMLKTELVFLFSMWMIFVCALKSGKLQDSDIYGPRFKGVCQTAVCFLLSQNTDLNFLVCPRESIVKVRSRGSCHAYRIRRRHVLHLLPLQSASRRWDLGYVMWCVTSSFLGLPSWWGEKMVLVENGIVETYTSSQHCNRLPASRSIKVYKQC